MTTSQNYDYTSSKRMQRRNRRIRLSGLSHLKVIMHRDDAEVIRAFARQCYEARGLTYDVNSMPHCAVRQPNTHISILYIEGQQ